MDRFVPLMGPSNISLFVLVSARKSRGGEWWSPDDYDVRDSHGKVQVIDGARRNRAIAASSNVTCIDIGGGMVTCR
jgi:hypothetical protein